MKVLWLTVLVAGMFLLTGCGDLLSLEPLATKENAVFDSALPGTWTDNQDTLCVVRAANPVYRIVWISAGDGRDETRLEGRLVRMGEERVLDVSGVDPGAFSVAAHVFLRVRISRGTMELRFLDSDWLQQQVKQSSLAYSVIGEGHPIITAPPAQLLTFLQQFGLKEEAMDKPILLTRLVPEGSRY